MQLNPFHKDFYKNPADSAMPYLEQIPGAVSPYYEPYRQAGTDALSTLMEQYQQLINDPAALMQMLGQGYEESPGYNFQFNQGMNASNNAAAAGGMLGTPAHQFQSASMASNLANQDFNDYLSRVLGLYGQGMQGFGNINQMGYNASNEMGNTIGNNLVNQANMSYLGTSNQNQYNADLFNTLLGGAVGGLTGYFNR